VRRAQAINEKCAVEVIDFVLGDPGHQSRELAANFVASEIKRLDLDFGISHDGRPDSRNAQATLFIFVLTAAAAQHWIDENVFKLAGVGIALFIRDKQPIGQIDLVRRQADALVLVHQFDHLGDDFAQLRINSLERLRVVSERRMRILNDLKTQSTVQMVEFIRKRVALWQEARDLTASGDCTSSIGL